MLSTSKGRASYINGLFVTTGNIDLLDAEKIWIAAHTLKSSSAQLGAYRLAEICAEIEERGHKNRLEGVRNCWLELEEELKLVVKEFERIVEKQNR